MKKISDDEFGKLYRDNDNVVVAELLGCTENEVRTRARRLHVRKSAQYICVSHAKSAEICEYVRIGRGDSVRDLRNMRITPQSYAAIREVCATLRKRRKMLYGASPISEGIERLLHRNMSRLMKSAPLSEESMTLMRERHDLLLRLYASSKKTRRDVPDAFEPSTFSVGE